MKNLNYYAGLFVLSLALISSSCSSDDSNNNLVDNSQEIAQIENRAMSGNWTISSYIDSGKDETNDFLGYTFTFSADGTLTADNGSNTLTGSWSVTDSSNSSGDSSSDDDLDFNISFPVPDTDVFDDLNDDWDIVSHSDTSISLMDISGGDGSTDTLVFQKN